MIYRSTVAMLLFSALFATMGRASETPHSMWLKAKCALCHGEDGSGNTPQGKKLNVRDLRAAEVQKLTDAELTQIIASGHSRMPAFGAQVKPEQIPLLVRYIRDIAKK